MQNWTMLIKKKKQSRQYDSSIVMTNNPQAIGLTTHGTGTPLVHQYFIHVSYMPVAQAEKH